MSRRIRRLVASLRLILAGILLPALLTPVAASNVPSQPSSIPTQTVEPLPGGCIGITPPGEPPPACCLSGFVYSDGAVVDGAEVEMQTQRGAMQTRRTERHSDESRPYYQLSLSAAPLNVVPGDTITVTARYGSQQRSLRYVVQPGSQQVDMVLPRSQSGEYTFDRQIWNQGEAGLFNRPMGVAIDAAGNIYVADAPNGRIQVFDRTGEFLRQWGTLGGKEGQLGFSLRVAVDHSGNVYVTESVNHRV